VAVGLLQPIADLYVASGAISNADLWTLAANVATEVMGGPKIPTRFGRVDATSSAESVEGAEGRLPDGDKGIDHLRDIFAPKGFSDEEIVALSGAHTVGGCKAERSGFVGEWTENPLAFDNGYFKEMLAKAYAEEIAPNGNVQFRDADTGTIMARCFARTRELGIGEAERELHGSFRACAAHLRPRIAERHELQDARRALRRRSGRVLRCVSLRGA
jgi:catalase (peroxidase I)